MESLSIRDARPEESKSILELVLAAYAEFRDEMEPGAWAGLESAILRVFSSRPDAEQIVATTPEGIVGSVLLYPAGADAYGGAIPPLPWPEVRLLAVSPAARGGGVASRLMRECVRRVVEQGAVALGIHTSRSMRAALEMYRKMGFVRRPEYDFHPPGGELVEAHVLSLPQGALPHPGSDRTAGDR